MRPKLGTRASGVLLHPTSLPGPHGIGDLGPEAHRFADFLERGRQSWWQMLPVVPPGDGHSPYQSASAFAGSPLLISLEALARRGLLEGDQLQASASLGRGRARYAQAWRFREPRLRDAFSRFQADARQRRGFEAFRLEHRSWLEDYTLFCALAQAHGGRPWTAWPTELRVRKPGALARARRSLAEAVRYHEFLQFEFHRQWEALRRHCRARGLGLMGDVPIFVAHDSADVWAHQRQFRLDAHGRPRVVAGCPPDYFSSTGQLWGNPLYRWPAMRRRGYDWWLARLRLSFQRFDAVRLDHFIGFHNYWEVPGRARTARGGRWVPGPRAHFFETVFAKLGRLQLVAEDLGAVTPGVEALRDRFGLPGIKVLQFAFGSDASQRPHHYPRNCVVYTGTHDNDTTRGWFRGLGRDPGTRRERETVRRYLACDGRQIHWDLLRLAWQSASATAIVPAQDLLGLGSAARMNLPATPRGNWAWRLRPGVLDDTLADQLAELTSTYGRARA